MDVEWQVIWDKIDFMRFPCHKVYVIVNYVIKIFWRFFELRRIYSFHFKFKFKLLIVLLLKLQKVMHIEYITLNLHKAKNVIKKNIFKTLVCRGIFCTSLVVLYLLHLYPKVGVYFRRRVRFRDIFFHKNNSYRICLWLITNINTF